MRDVHLADGLKLRFAGRGAEFDEGFEAGMLAALMEAGCREFSRWISSRSVEQVRAIARKLDYHLVESGSDGEWAHVTLRFRHARPQLRLVRS